MDNKFIVGLIVSNHFGVLNRVAGLYSKRNYNIDSLAVGETENPEYSRMTIVSTGDKYMEEQVVRQLQKLHDVKLVVVLDEQNSVSVEHMLIKLKANGDRTEISELINTYGGKVMDFSNEYITSEITASSEKIDEFIEKAKLFGILEVCRSGSISMVHGTENMLSINNL
ncbi:MAG: acetolactate synthase small subunit [Bacillota bacterium]|nr:acetolactate synthase small subunit [Bacillota bacterium]